MPKITTESIVNAPLIKTCNTYTDSKMIVGWAFASDDWECPLAENDLQVEGRFLTRMSAKDKSFAFDFTGIYTEVTDLQKISYKMDKEEGKSECRGCDITFEDVGDDRTKVTVVFDSEDQNPIETQKTGWQSILDNFKKFAERC